MDSTILVISFLICYFVFGLRAGKRFVDKRMPADETQESGKKVLRYVCIALVAIVFAYIELARWIIKLVVKLFRLVQDMFS